MTCYIRHLDEVFEDLGMEKNKENRRKLDLMIREKIKMKDADCSEVWARIKKITNNRSEMINLTNLLRGK